MVVEAIEGDTVLTPRQKKVLTDLYRTLVATSQAPADQTMETTA
jgi:hypothetical protein